MNYLVPVIVGAVIGYITNWLAIKMLFRPYEEKHILGFKIPFTPGLIPKEKARIAKSVGDTVGEYLLSEKVIMENLKKNNIDEKIKSFIKLKFNIFYKQDYLIKDLVNKFKLRRWIENLENFLLEKIYSEVNTYNFKPILSNLVDDINYNDFVDKFSHYIKEELTESKIKSHSKNILDKLEDDLKNNNTELKEFIKIEDIDLFIDRNQEFLKIEINKALNKKDNEIVIKDILRSTVEKKMSRALMLFITPDIISEKVYESILDFMRGEDFYYKLLPFLKKVSYSVLDFRIKEIYNLLNIDEKSSEKLADVVYINLFKNENKTYIVNQISMKLKSKERELKEEIKESLSIKFERYFKSEEFKILLDNILKGFIKDLENKNLKEYINKVSVEEKDKILNEIVNKTMGLIYNETPKLIKRLNISKIVEDEINSFDVEFAEKLILDIASKELKAITSLGAVLGALMGFLTPILSKLI